MRDINFFKPYIQKKERKFDKRIIYYSLLSLVLVMFAAYSIYNFVRIKKQTYIVNRLKSTAEDPETLRKVEKIKLKEVEVEEFRKTVDRIKILDEKIMSQDIIKEELLEIISLRMPENLVLTYLSVENPVIQLRGVAQDKYSVAEFVKGLEDIENVDDIFVSNITTEVGYYSFSITITLKDVSVDGEATGN